MVVQDSEKALERLDGPLKVKIEAEPAQDLGLEVAEHLLVDILLLLLGEEADHPGKAG